jgi:hypothetical protein
LDPATYQPWGRAYNAGDRVAGKAALEAYAEKRWNCFMKLGICVWVGEIGFNPVHRLWQEQMEDEHRILEEGGLSYALFAFGVGTWNSVYDIVGGSPTYSLTTVGLIYRNFIKSKVARPPDDKTG